MSAPSEPRLTHMAYEPLNLHRHVVCFWRKQVILYQSSLKMTRDWDSLGAEACDSMPRDENDSRGDDGRGGGIARGFQCGRTEATGEAGRGCGPGAAAAV